MTYNSRAYVISGEVSSMLAGNGPILVSDDFTVEQAGTNRSVEESVAAFERATALVAALPFRASRPNNPSGPALTSAERAARCDSEHGLRHDRKLDRGGRRWGLSIRDRSGVTPLADGLTPAQSCP